MTKEIQKRSDYPKQKKIEKEPKAPFWPKVGNWGAKAFNFCSTWVARAILAISAFAGAMYLLDGVDPVIKLPAGIILVALLLKESY